MQGFFNRIFPISARRFSFHPTPSDPGIKVKGLNVSEVLHVLAQVSEC